MEWHIHLGAHKTATTHFQDILAENIRGLSEAGTFFVPRDTFRANKINNRIVNGALSADFLGVLASEFPLLKPTSGYRRVLLSEENILGSSKDLLEAPLYPSTGHRLRAWAKLLEGEDVRLYLTIRDFSGLFPSAYSQATRQGFALRPFDFYAKRGRIAPPSWIELIERIRAAFPNSPLRIWTFESYIENPAALLRWLAVGEIEVSRQGAPSSTKSLSASTITLVQKSNAWKAPKWVRRKIARYYVSQDRGEGFKPFSLDELNYFSSLYQSELHKIGADYTCYPIGR